MLWRTPVLFFGILAGGIAIAQTITVRISGSVLDLGPSPIKFLTANVRHQFSFGTIQAILSRPTHVCRSPGGSNR